jgi:hypothetical protein
MVQVWSCPCRACLRAATTLVWTRTSAFSHCHYEHGTPHAGVEQDPCQEFWLQLSEMHSLAVDFAGRPTMVY